MLKNIPVKGFICITIIINAILKFAYFPQQWKVSKVVAIPKPGKNQSYAENYRPISLLNTLSKVVEKIYCTRINAFIKKHNLLIDEQFGFRANHSTTAQLARLVDHISDGFNLHKHTRMILLDIAKAFDTV